MFSSFPYIGSAYCNTAMSYKFPEIYPTIIPRPDHTPAASAPPDLRQPLRKWQRARDNLW